MSARCPRCRREAPDLTAFCAGCGAPLLLADEPSPRPLDESVELDRRGPRPAPDEPTLAGVRPPPLRGSPAGAKAPPAPRAPPAVPAQEPPPRPARASELADLERSQWDIGRAATALAAPEPAPAPPPPSAAPEPAPDALPDAEVDALEVHVVRAPGWRRAVAWLLDVLPFAGGAVALASFLVREASPARPVAPLELEALLDLVIRERAIAASVVAAAVLCLAVYATLAHALAGATLGKWLLGLRVIGPDGTWPSPARSATRTTLALLSAGLLGLGFLLALFTRSGRALHDFLARTWVVKAP